jgi:glycosyltransferase involved in cell wall biosynthesis
MKKLLFITWSVSYGYGTEKSMADVLNRINTGVYDISILPLFKNSKNSIFKQDIKILEPLIDYTQENFNEEKALKNYYSYLANPLKFNRLIKDKYDCIIACNHNAPSYLASYIKGGVKILWIRGDMQELNYKKLNPNTKEYKQVKQEHKTQKDVLKAFDTIVVISDVVKKALKELFNITENVVKISNSVDSKKIKALSLEKINTPNKMLFTSLGRLDYNKNQIMLLKAVKKVQSHRSDFVVYILGEGEDRPKLEKYIEENNLKDYVMICGFEDNPYPYIKNSVATVTTSLSEGFGLVLVESVMLNTPIISTNVGVAKELTEKYNCGDIIDYDENQLAQIMIKYMNRYDGYKNIYNVDKEYDIKLEVSKTVTLIDKAVKKKREQSKIKALPYPQVTIQECQLKDYKIPNDHIFMLRVIKDNVPYEYLINRQSNNEKLIVFNNGAVTQGEVSVPVFQRHSWAKLLKTSSVFCMDPTLYLNGMLKIGWGIGKNDNYYLENSSLILKKLIEKMGINLENTAIYGTSAGGYLSIIMGIYLKGAKVVADNSQLDVRKWIFKDALDSVLMVSFDNIGEALNYKERFSVVDAFKKHCYVPKIYIHVNLCSTADNTTQLVPFLKDMETINGKLEYNEIEVFLHYEPDKGHNGISMEEAISFLYSILDEG